jgi:hypothetical protein
VSNVEKQPFGTELSTRVLLSALCGFILASSVFIELLTVPLKPYAVVSKSFTAEDAKGAVKILMRTR